MDPSVKRGQVTFLTVGAIKNKKIICALEWLERFAYRKADRIVAVTNAFKLHIVAHGGSESKTTVIRNGVDSVLLLINRAMCVCRFAGC